jgi:hypothetical protein
VDANRLDRIRNLARDGATDEEPGVELPARPAGDGLPASSTSPGAGRGASVSLRARRLFASSALVVIVASVGGWWWQAGAYRRAATSALAGSISRIEFQPSQDSDFAEFSDPHDIDYITTFLIEARDEPERGEPGHEVGIREPDCRMRIHFADGRVEDLMVGDTLPSTSGRGLAVVVRANAVIAWRGFRRFGAGEILGQVYGRNADAGKLVFREVPARTGKAP